MSTSRSDRHPGRMSNDEVDLIPPSPVAVASECRSGNGERDPGFATQIAAKR